MELFLMVGALSLFGLAITCIAFGAATRGAGEPEPVAEPEREPAVAPARFFGQPAVAAAISQRVPVEALLLQIETHVRLEQAAAESFVESPTPALLHGRTMSPLVHSGGVL